jgi:hypothetical protein
MYSNKTKQIPNVATHFVNSHFRACSNCATTGRESLSWNSSSKTSRSMLKRLYGVCISGGAACASAASTVRKLASRSASVFLRLRSALRAFSSFSLLAWPKAGWLAVRSTVPPETLRVRSLRVRSLRVRYSALCRTTHWRWGVRPRRVWILVCPRRRVWTGSNIWLRRRFRSGHTRRRGCGSLATTKLLHGVGVLRKYKHHI